MTSPTCLRLGPAWLAKLAPLFVACLASTAHATTKVCVSVEEKTWTQPRPTGETVEQQHEELSPQDADVPQAQNEDAPPSDETSQDDPTSSDDNSSDDPASSDQETDTSVPGLGIFGQLLSGSSTPTATAAPGHDSNVEDPHDLDPTLHLTRLLEYEVTHEVGFEAVKSGCDQTLVVELYPLDNGWTVFGRYSGHAREEKVQKVQVDELAPLAQRLTLALLYDKTIDKTINRSNVLRADSEGDLQQLGVQGYALFGLGTSIRGAVLDTADNPNERATDKIRILTPVSGQLGYRGKFRAWGLDAYTRFSVGTRESSVRENPMGGHVDYDGGASVGLNFLHYARPEGMTSFYFGGGASFELSFFSIVRQPERRGKDREGLVGGGLDINALVGYEFMRASALHFVAQVELHAPAYIVNAENGSGTVYTYLPGSAVVIGAAF